MAKKNPIIQMPEGMLHEGETILPLNVYSKEGYVINEGYFVTNQLRYFTTTRGRFEEKSLAESKGQMQLAVMTDKGQKHLNATRGMMATFYPIEDMYNKQVIHEDGNPSNNDINNLYWGTWSDSASIAAKNENRKAKTSLIITDDIVRLIIQYAEEGKTDEEIVRLLPIETTPETVRHVRGGYPPYDKILLRLGLQSVKQVTRKQITPEMRAAIRHDAAQGATKAQLAHKYGIAPDTARKYVEEYRREHKEVKREGPLEIRKEKSKKKCPIILARATLESGEEIIPVNRYTKPGCVIDNGYFASTLGHIYSVIRGGIFKRLIPHETQSGYLDVTLNTDQGPKHVMVHRLILCSFQPVEGMENMEVDHIYGNKHDNILSQLRWAKDAKENMKFAREMGLLDNAPQQYASEHDIRLVHKLAEEGFSDPEIAVHPEMERKYYPSTIGDIRAGIQHYGPLLEKYGIKPYKYHRGAFTEDEKKQIYDYIEACKDEKGLMQAYEDAADVFGASYHTTRHIYSAMRTAQ